MRQKLRSTAFVLTLSFSVLSMLCPEGFAASRETKHSIPELPRATVNTAMPTQNGLQHECRSSEEFRQALDRAAPGDSIVLQAGEVFTGPYTLPAKHGEGWIVIRTSAIAQLPPQGTRITPPEAELMPKVVTAANGQPALRTANGARRYRLIGIEFTAAENVRTVSAIVEISHDSTKLEDVPSHIVFDRVYIHGSPELNSQRGLAINSQWTAVTDSWISACHIHGFDSQAIANWNGPGPFKIENNFLEGGSENIMFGGAKNSAESMVASDIEIRRNHLYKNPAWAELKYPDNWVIKNSFEIKNARRVLFEGNIIENCWAEAQTGFAFVLKSASPDQGRPWDSTSDLTIRYNRIINVLNGFSIARWSSNGPVVPGAPPTSRILIEHNVFERFGSKSDFARTGRGAIFFQGSCNGLTIRHNTAWNDVASIMLTKSGTDDFVFTDNLLTPGEYFLHADGGKEPGWFGALKTHLHGDCIMEGNVIIRAGSERARQTNAGQFPPGNLWFDSFASAGASEANYCLLPQSPALGYGAAEPPPGADIGAVLAATKNVQALMP